MTDTGHPRTTGPVWFDNRTAEAQLRRLSRLVVEQFAAEVTAQRLDIEVANGMLDVFGLLLLPRR
jgi:hypothetical protein